MAFVCKHRTLYRYDMATSMDAICTHGALIARGMKTHNSVHYRRGWANIRYNRNNCSPQDTAHRSNTPGPASHKIRYGFGIIICISPLFTDNSNSPRMLVKVRIPFIVDSVDGQTHLSESFTGTHLSSCLAPRYSPNGGCSCTCSGGRETSGLCVVLPFDLALTIYPARTPPLFGSLPAC
jgi:hypothetical protein